MLNWLKWTIARKEMLTLERYRTACNTAGRWLAGHTPAACETAYWIQDVAEGKRPDDIEKFREQLRPNAALTGGEAVRVERNVRPING